MRSAVTAWVALGANLGQAIEQVRWGIEALARVSGIDQVESSRLYRSAPHQAQGPDFINAVVRLQTQLSAPQLLDALQALEQQAGRQRPYHHAPRTLDLDLLFYGDARLDSPRLTVPHPRWAQRAFVLRPLADVSPERVSSEALRLVSDQPIEPIE
ncbi:MAG: 2-amino-4-hydroxy-6-hydroxymethyldihydropteridine diphosphokinase [Alphaproteobacteria bacterium]|nr:2-amino-4-hydroxy-6-hydroxymethyldihydropteridine diphosphokinase [Alphaproteobacteria bacterium]